ncbi:MAG TPA: hypothetical protein VIP28_03880 [Nocardioides sp.]
MAPVIIPVRHASFDVTTSYTSAGLLVVRATCDVLGCAAYAEAAWSNQADVLADALDHQAAHLQGGRRLQAVADATIGRAA